MSETQSKNAVPTPGSQAALIIGCTCAVIDNHCGRGRPAPDGSRQFWISGDCPVHARAAITQEPK